MPANENVWKALGKPAGLVTTHRDEKGRPTVFDALPKELPRVISVGRLDLNSEGLLLLTNDGGLARRLELPATGWLRRYKVRVHGEVDHSVMEGACGCFVASEDKDEGDNGGCLRMFRGQRR